MDGSRQKHPEDNKVINDLQRVLDAEGLRSLRSRIDRMTNQNLRRAALAMWHEKTKHPER